MVQPSKSARNGRVFALLVALLGVRCAAPCPDGTSAQLDQCVSIAPGASTLDAGARSDASGSAGDASGSDGDASGSDGDASGSDGDASGSDGDAGGSAEDAGGSAEDAQPDADASVGSDAADAGCSDQSSVDSCGSTCSVCPSAPENAHRTCTDAGCDFSCEDGFLRRGSGCLVAELFVDPVRGRDEPPNSGTDLLPYRTFQKAMSVASSEQTVRFAFGEYRAEDGQDFNQPIPDGVTLLPRTNAHPIGTVSFVGSGSESLLFLGGATLKWLSFRGLQSVVAGTGKQILETVDLTTSHILLAGDARFECTGCGISSPPQTSSISELVLLQGSAHLELKSAEGKGKAYVSSDCDSVSRIRLIEQSSAFFDDVGIGTGSTAGLQLESEGAVRLNRVTFSPDCGRGILASGPVDVVDVEISNSEIEHSLNFIEVKRLKVRNTRFLGNGGIMIMGMGDIIDLGMPGADGGGDPGGNTFPAGLMIMGSANIVNASGNTWLPNTQGADAAGHYKEGTTLSNAIDPASTGGPNILIVDLGTPGSEARL